MALLYTTLWKYEMASKNTTWQLRALRRHLIGEQAPSTGRSAAPQST
jgi:heme exporter protein C